MCPLESQELKTMVIDTEMAIIDDRLAYSSQTKAEEMAKDIGCQGIHTHELDGQVWFMPCEQHSMTKEEFYKHKCPPGYKKDYKKHKCVKK